MIHGRILVVEDSPSQAEVIAELLRKEGHDVTVAPDGGSAIRRVKALPPELVLLDMVLPDRSGAEVLRIVKALPDLFIPVILISAKADLEARVKGLQDELRQARDRLDKLSVTDGLTGIPNHRHFQEQLRKEWGRAQRYQSPLSLVMIDLDHFKSVNDRYLHTFGDKVLKGTAEVIRHSLRDPDVCARYGGEEFAVILPNTNLQGATRVAERIREGVAGQGYFVDGARDDATGKPLEVGVTCSSGVAAYPSRDVSGVEQLVRHADEALFKAKADGRNCVWVYAGDYHRHRPEESPHDGVVGAGGGT
jgi:diguanylate cyclase (GGDEF)-like protein